MNKKLKNPVVIYTDGSCDPNPGPGGWAALIIKEKENNLIKGSERYSTNNRMELTAALKGLKEVGESEEIILYTDSQYLQKGVKEWITNWEARGWRRKGGKLANVDLWKEIAQEIDKRQITWRWVRGHAGNPFNERVDRAAQKMAASAKG